MNDFIYDDYRYSGETSSAINAAYYNSDLLTLVIEFHNGQKAAYTGVTSETWQSYVAVDSVGSFYNRQIVGQARFPGTSADFSRFVARNSQQGQLVSADRLYKATIVVKATSFDSLVAAVVDMGVSEDDIVKVERA